MSSQPGNIKLLRKVVLGSAVLGLLLLAAPGHSKRIPCAATTTASLQACINTAHAVGDTSSDTTWVKLAPGQYAGSQIRINRRKNLWIEGDTTATEATQPQIIFQDRQHINTDTVAALRADTSATGTYGQNNGTVWIHESDNICLMGLLIDGNSSLVTRTNTAGRIFAYGANLGKSAPVEIRGNVGVNILLSRNVKLRYLSVTNTWNGISVISPNLGGAFAFPDPNDPVAELVATLPTSRAGLYGNHLIERCRIHDNVFGMLFQRDWDLSSVVRNNLFWGNYMRHWGDARTPSGYISNLYELDTTRRADGSRRSLAYTTVGGAFLMTDVALTPYRIHNNTFHNNATIFSGYYKTGTQHLFYNNLVGRPYQFFRSAVSLNVEASNRTYTAFRNGYTQTERNSEMLQYLSEHQRSNRVVAQDSIPRNTAVVPNYWGPTGGNFRLYNMRMIRTPPDNWVDARSWSNNAPTMDSLGMTWVPDTTAAGTIAAQGDTGGIVSWVRHNMWVGAAKDPKLDPNVGENWCPPWIPINIRKSLGDPKIFRNTSAFDLRWTLGLPLDTLSAVTSASWLTPQATNLKMDGWLGYEGTATKALAIGAYDPAGGWAAPARRLVLRDTLIETVLDSLVKFRLNVSGEGLANSDIAKLEVASAKFYNDVPVSDTLYNQGLDTVTRTGTTTRVNSILSSKPWPLPYQFLSSDYNRAGYRVDDSLTKNKLRSDNIFLGRIGAGFRLPPTDLYARAEVVLKATLTDGTIVYSNPGVFTFSRPRFQFDVRVVDAITGKELPNDPDGISIVAQARQPLKVIIKAKTIATLPVPFKGYGNLQMGNAGGLHGDDGRQLEQQRLALWTPRQPNDTVTPYFAQNDSVYDTLRAMASPSNGTLIYRAVFMDRNGALLPYFIEGRSSPLKIVSGSIYQATIDSVFRGTTLLSSPDYRLKMRLNESAGGRRDTILSVGPDTSGNLSEVSKGDTLRVVLQVRDKFGYRVLDTTSASSGLYISLAHVLPSAGRYPQIATDPGMVLLDSAGTAVRKVRLAFDQFGRATAKVYISQFASPATLASLRAAIVDSLGREIGTSGSTRDSGVVDTTWLKTDKASIGIVWTDTLGAAKAPITDGWVGEWYPVRLKMVKNRKGAAFTGSVDISSLAPVRLHPAKGDLALADSVVFAGDSLSSIVWIRADDSVTGAWVRGRLDSLVADLGGLSFRYPQIASASFHDRDCDGKVDSLVLRMNGPLSFRPVTGVVAGDTLDARFPHQHLSTSAFGAPERAMVHFDSVQSFAWTPGALGAADARADRVTVGNPLVPGKSISYSIANLVDLAPPVAVSAFDRQTWDGLMIDSLVVQFSETIQLSTFAKGAVPPFRIVRGGAEIPMDAFKLAKPAAAVGDSGQYAFVFQSGAGVFQQGDSLVVDGTSVSDLAGNRSGTVCENKKIGITLNPLYIPTQGKVIDIDGDGNADSVHLGFKDSLGTLPERILVRWGSPAETLTVTKAQLIQMGVKTSDSTITVWTRGWNGQTIIIDGDTIRNAPRTKGPWDSAWFDGGYSREWLADQVPPVLIRARIKWGSDIYATGRIQDTLTVDFSEPVTGCAVGSDPAQCLTAQGVNPGTKFGEGSTILRAEGARWIVLVPRTATSLVPTDSLRATPSSQSGKLLDVVNNIVGDRSPYREVLGDPAPPSRSLMMDRDGDGRVDAVLLQYAIKPSVAKLPPFEFEWGDSAGVSVKLVSDSAYMLEPTRWVAVLKTPGAFPATGYGPSGVRPNLGKQLSQSMSYVFPVRDSAGAVLKPKAELDASSAKDGVDTLVVWPSEPLRDPTASVLLEFRRNGATIPAADVKFLSATSSGDGSWKVLVGPNSTYRPSVGDSTRLSTSGSVLDTVSSANKPHPDHPWVALSGALRVPYASAYRDENKDGRIETAVFEFANPVIEGTRIRVFDPAGTDSYREFVIGASDVGKTRIEFGFAAQPWGQNVTSLVKPDLGLLLPSTKLDSNIYKGGKFNIADEAEPVISKANIYYNSDTAGVDTMVIKVSEWIKIDPSKPVIRYRAGDSTSDSGLPIYADPRYAIVYDSAKGTITVMLKPFPSGYSNPTSGDSVRFSWEGVQDKAGNKPGVQAKWTEIIANQRVFPPVIEVTNPIVTDITHKAGDKLEGSQFELVARPSTPNGEGVWQTSTPGNGTWIPGTSSYNPRVTGKMENGTVIFIQTNVPTNITVYIYDNLGTFVGQIEREITQEMLDRLPKSPIGMTDVGVLWKGQRQDGRLVSSGIYPIRLLATRKPVEDEKAKGKTGHYVYNKLVNVGVKLRLENNW